MVSKADVFALAVPFIQHFEECRLYEYLDARDLSTIGWGQRITHGQYPHGITQSQADQMLIAALDWRYERMITLIRVNATAGQLAACLSFIYNVGFGRVSPFIAGFITSTLLKLINSGRLQEAAAEFVKWNKAGGKELDGLKRRRQCESLLFSGKTIADLKQMNWLE